MGNQDHEFEALSHISEGTEVLADRKVIIAKKMITCLGYDFLAGYII